MRKHGGESGIIFNVRFISCELEGHNYNMHIIICASFGDDIYDM